MEKETSSKNPNRGFNFIIKWSLLFFVILVIVGLIYRIFYPVKLDLDESEFVKQVFTLEQTDAYVLPADTLSVLGEFDPGEVLFVVDESEEQYLVRPLITSRLDSVWIDQNNVFDYSPENYRQWQYEQDRRSLGSDN